MRSPTVLAIVALAACGGGEASRDHASDHPGATDDRGHHHAHDHDFSDVARYEAMFDAPDRDDWQRPDDVVSALALEPSMIVADLGTGTGYFLARLSAAVPAGRVLALDVEPAMIEHVRARVEREGLSNVEARVVATDDPGLAASSVDRVLIVDTWHHIENRGAYLARLAAGLRPFGSLLIVDFTRDAPHGPPPEMRLSAEDVLRELTSAGWTAEIVDEPLPMQWIVRATPAAPVAGS
jgi:SAM-dependent methyltransferase